MKKPRRAGGSQPEQRRGIENQEWQVDSRRVPPAQAPTLLARPTSAVLPLRNATPVDPRECEAQFRCDATYLHALGPRVLYELLAELGAARLCRTEIETIVARYITYFGTKKVQ